MKFILAFLFVSLFVSCPHIIDNTCAADEEQVTFYLTYGYREGDDWMIPMRVWVHERRGLAEEVLARTAKSIGRLAQKEIDNFRLRIEAFVADSESGEMVTFAFDHDPENRAYRVQSDHKNFPKTDLNGLVEGVIKIPIAKAKELLRLQDSQNGWLTYRVTNKGHSGEGRVCLLEPTGLSVISDIDDTIKITEIPAGLKVIVRNTFFRDFVAVPVMAKMYQKLNGASFHYVSGSPWQLYRPLSQFLFSEKGGYPEGTFHMKNVRKNLLSSNTWEDLKELVTNENATYDQKVAQISEIMERFPKRKFILVGDSGEKDPEVYHEIKKKFSDQVQEIIIRDVVNDRVDNKSRLEGMTIIQAPTVIKGVSLFGN